MSHLSAMKQIGVRNMGFQVELMEWSNKMDLVALGSEKGEVIIQRLNWQKICTFPSPGENLKVKALAWQPEEKIIAVGYSNGKIALLDVEKEDEVFSFDCGDDIKRLNWSKSTASAAFSESSGYCGTINAQHDNFLPKLPSLSLFSSIASKSDYNSSRNFGQNSSNFLVVCLTSGAVCLSVFGVLPCGRINISQYVNSENFEVYDVRMSCSFHEIFVFVRDDTALKMLVFQNDILSKYTCSLLNVAVAHAHVLETMNYINDTVQCIIEAWETVLLEMDNKITKYANSQPEGSVSADFLELLMFGCPSKPLEQFLIRELTEKGLKKLGSSIELSYSTIQSLVVKPLHSAAINLFYHLNVLKGFARNTYGYKALLTEQSADKAISSAGGFLIKILELQQTIDQSVTDYKIFWCWLYMAIVRLMDESVPDEVASVTQEDITYLAEFLNNFDDCIFEKGRTHTISMIFNMRIGIILEDGTFGKRKFNLERVGQYLEDCELQFPPKFDGHHQWNKLLEENECLRTSNLIFPHQTNFSLLQQHNLLKSCINELFAKPNKIIEESFTLRTSFVCASVNPEKVVKTSYMVDDTTSMDMLTASINEKEIILLEFQTNSKSVKSSKITLKENQTVAEAYVKDLQFYNENTLSVLINTVANEKSTSHFIQFPLQSIRARHCTYASAKLVDLNNVFSHSLFDIYDPQHMKAIDGFSCAKIAVSGSRKVASVLSDNYRKIRIYEMETEEDEDEIEMSQNTILDTSKESVQSQ